VLDARHQRLEPIPATGDEDEVMAAAGGIGTPIDLCHGDGGLAKAMRSHYASVET
jgi:hypothetical protein